MSEEYKMPSVFVGDIVLWYHGGHESNAPSPAMVTAVYPDSVSISIMDDARREFRIPQEPQRHFSDPRARHWMEDDASAGLWKHRPETIAMRQLFAEKKRELKDKVA